MAKRGGKKLPDKRGFVDGPGGYRGKDDRDKGFGGGSGTGSGGTGSGGGNFNTGIAPGDELSALDQIAEDNLNQAMNEAGYVQKNFNLDPLDPMSQFQVSQAPNAAPLDPTVPNALLGTDFAPNPNLAAELAAQEPQPFSLSNLATGVGQFFNSPIGQAIGFATNPAAFFSGQLLKNLYKTTTDEDDDTGIMSALASTTQDVTPFDTSRLSNIFSGVPSTEKLNTTTNIGDTFTMPEQSFVNSLFTDQNYGLSPEAKQGITTTPVGVAQQTYGDPTGAASYNFGAQGDPQLSMEQLNTMAAEDYANRVAAQQQPGFFSGLDIQPAGLEREGNRGPSELIPPPDATTLPVEENPFIGFGSIDPRPNYGLLYGGGFNQGGLVPPMSGPMSDGLGNLFKMK